MNYKNFEKFQMTTTGYIYVSKKTHKIHSISLFENDLRFVQNGDNEAHLLIKGLLINCHQDYPSEFYRLMDFVDKENDPFIWDALRAFREICHNARFDAAIGIYQD